MRALVYHLNHLELRKQANVTEPLGQAPVVQSRNPLDLTVETNMNYESAAPTPGELNINYENLALDMNYENLALDMNYNDSALNNFAATTQNCPNCSSRDKEFDNSIAGFCCMGCGTVISGNELEVML
jgi:hypothetical protein